LAQEYLEFEKPIAELEKKIEELTLFTSNGDINLEEEILKLHKKSAQGRDLLTNHPLAEGPDIPPSQSPLHA
jgi:acetyl-CoA carboxylase alpha subunit